MSNEYEGIFFTLKLKTYIYIYSNDGKADFLVAITPVFSVTWSLRNIANMLMLCSRNISDYYQCWNSYAAQYFSRNHDTFFSGFFDKSKIQKNSIYYKYKSFLAL